MLSIASPKQPGEPCNQLGVSTSCRVSIITLWVGGSDRTGRRLCLSNPPPSKGEACLLFPFGPAQTPSAFYPLQYPASAYSCILYFLSMRNPWVSAGPLLLAGEDSMTPRSISRPRDRVVTGLEGTFRCSLARAVYRNQSKPHEIAG